MGADIMYGQFDQSEQPFNPFAAENLAVFSY